MSRMLALLACALLLSACGKATVYAFNGQEYAHLTDADSVTLLRKLPDGTWQTVHAESGGTDILVEEPGLYGQVLKGGVLVGSVYETQIVRAEKRPPRTAPGEGVRRNDIADALVVDENQRVGD